MPNNYFQFKQFIIHQDNCAMKVCTDACVLGAWAAERMKGSPVKNILDIGSGTGLLSLMLAQKISASIDAIEIDPLAAEQAKENVLNSIWHDNIHVIQTDLRNFIPGIKYDLIISNPPFFEDDLRSGNEQKNAAKHDSTLKLQELIQAAADHLDENGCFIVLLPFHRTGYFEEQGKIKNMFVKEKLFISQSTAHDHFRSVLVLAKKEQPVISTHELTIHDTERNYTFQHIGILSLEFHVDKLSRPLL